MQKLFESVKIALQSIWANKLRSFMTVLGNIVAVTSIVTVVSLIQGMNAYVTSAIMSNVGADSFTIQQYGVATSDEDFDRMRGNPRITPDEAEAIRRFSSLVSAVMTQAQRQGVVAYKDISLDSVMVQGVTREYMSFSTFNSERGRMMSPMEVERNRPVVLLGWQTAERLFGNADPLDKVIRIEGIHFRVVGVSERRGSFLGRSQDEFAVIPLGTYEKLYGARQNLSLLVKPRDPSLIDLAKDDAIVALRVARRLKPKEPNNFGLFTSDTLLGLYRQATNGIFAVLVGVVALSLLVGGIVIMNIMLMVVSERTREIGLRKALGARRADIMSQVLTESVTLSTFGGIVGITLGFLVAQLISRLTPLPARLELWSVALGIGITAGVGLFFGAYPASRAARLDPIEALRRE
jgi:putative ABC transport system permease protein